MCRKTGPTEPVFWKHPSSERWRWQSLWVEWPRPRPGWLSRTGPPSGARPPPWPVSTEKRLQTPQCQGEEASREDTGVSSPGCCLGHSLAHGATHPQGHGHHSVSSHALGVWSGGKAPWEIHSVPKTPREGRCLRHSSGTLVLPITFRAALRPLLPQTYCVAIMRTSVLRVRDRQVTTRVRIICTGWFPHL